MNFSKFKNNISEEKIKVRKTVSLIGKNIATDWAILIILLSIILLLCLFYSWNSYKTISEQSFLNETDINQRSSLKVNNDQLEKVVADLNKKKESFDDLTGGMILSDTQSTASTTL